MVEIGGTVGDIESLPFLEAIRQMRHDVGSENSLYMHVTLVPYIGAANELKTKPTQHSVKELTSHGIQPNIIVCRSDQALDSEIKTKISHFCNVPANCVVSAADVKSIYELPLALHAEELDQRVVESLHIWTGQPNLEPWKKISREFSKPKNGTVLIGMIGKYVDLTESYKSYTEALNHSGFANSCKVEVAYVDSTVIEKEEGKKLDAFLIPGGFGDRGTEGKIQAVKYARENKIPFFGICLGLQMAVIDYARHMANIENATSEEFNPDSKNKVIHLME
ncbi:UNVERIFIED_CONTAM: hypothetical protein GTU68_050906, partial [Idotea baltica]|nr:hypothetical protein [Idotea baltica]